ncbi:MAG TPA: TolC family protein [Steroidobacteraceae bacterium]|nr:TolC family protein [Steroidobacteraceae bacterium]
MDAAIERALRDAPQVLSAQASLESAQQMRTSAGRLPDPELIVGVDNLPVTGPDQYSLTRDFMTMSKIGVMQEIPAVAKRRLRSDLASREADVARAQLRATQFEIASATAEAWIGAATSEDNLARLHALRRDLDTQSSAARAALASGRSTVADALSSESVLAQLDNQILELEQKRAMSQAELSRWVGAEASSNLAELPWRRELDVTPAALAENVAFHAPLAPIAARVEAARTAVDLARAEKRSDWSTELSYAKRGPDYSDMVSLEFRIGLPLFAKNRQNPEIAAKLASVRAAEAEEESAVRMHRAEIEGMAATWHLGKKRLEHFEATLLPLARDRTRAAISSYGSGRGELRAVLEAFRDEVDQQQQFVDLEGEVTRAWVFLHLLHSGGTP